MQELREGASKKHPSYGSNGSNGSKSNGSSTLKDEN